LTTRGGAVLGAALVALLAAEPAAAARFAVGVRDDASAERVAARIAASGAHVSRELAALGALVVRAPSAGALRRIPGVAYVERVDGRRRLAFVPNDPFAFRQWHLTQIRAFDYWPDPPLLPTVKVAIIDSGIDGGHPELLRRVAAARSFVGGSPLTDEQGHGTFLAGEIAAAANNQQGIAGIALSAQLLVAKVVQPDRTIALDAEAAAIRWAVDNGARVINLSLGGLRDPLDPRRDTYSRLEAAAVDYAARRGAVLVAAVGNGDQAPSQPWPYASYPAALPHVLGVGAVARDGSVPDFSNRDAIYNDLAAPGEDIFSTLPRSLTAARPGCPEQGYSSCGPDEYRQGDGTSFAAPQVSAAAAVLLAATPSLRPDQVTAILERSAVDVHAGTGCRRCTLSRDRLSGWGRLDVTRALGALGGQLPAADRFETNDDAGSRAWRLFGTGPAEVRATLDFWDDPVDVYAVRIRAGQRLTATVQSSARLRTRLVLWRPGTPTIVQAAATARRFRAAQAAGARVRTRLDVRAKESGWYYLELRLATRGSSAYTLAYAKR
jgi:subtilisin family serine protease